MFVIHKGGGYQPKEDVTEKGWGQRLKTGLENQGWLADQERRAAAYPSGRPQKNRGRGRGHNNNGGTRIQSSREHTAP